MKDLTRREAELMFFRCRKEKRFSKKETGLELDWNVDVFGMTTAVEKIDTARETIPERDARVALTTVRLGHVGRGQNSDREAGGVIYTSKEKLVTFERDLEIATGNRVMNGIISNLEPNTSTFLIAEKLNIPDEFKAVSCRSLCTTIDMTTDDRADHSFLRIIPEKGSLVLLQHSVDLGTTYLELHNLEIQTVKRTSGRIDGIGNTSQQVCITKKSSRRADRLMTNGASVSETTDFHVSNSVCEIIVFIKGLLSW